MSELRERGDPFFSTADGGGRRLNQIEQLVNTIGDGIYQLDREGRFVAVNDVVVETTGYSRDDLLGEHVSLLLEGDDVARIERVIEDALKTGDNVGETEVTVTTADDDRFRCELRFSLLVEDGEFQGTIGTVRDTTERHENKRDLQRERDLRERILEASSIGISALTPDGEILFANDRARDIVGTAEDPERAGSYRGPEWNVYDSDGEPIPPEERVFSRVRRTGEPVRNVESQVVRPDGDRVWLSVNGVPVFDDADELVHIVLTYEDISQLKSQSRQLERQRDDLRSELAEMYDRIDDAFLAIDDEWRVTHVNDRAASLLDRTVDDLIGELVWMSFPEVADSPFREHAGEAMETQEAVTFEEYYTPLDTWFEVRAYPSETGLSVYFQDVTERVERERDLLEYETIFETITDGVYVMDEDFQFTRVNDAYCEMTGYSRDELLGAHSSLVVSDDVSEESFQRVQEVAAGERDSAKLEADILRADGSTLRAESNFTALRDDDPDHPRKVGIVRNVSERVERERIIEAQRERLSALYYISTVVQEVTEAVIDQPTREDIERIVCDSIAASDTYLFAWIGEVSSADETISLRAEAGVDGYLDGDSVPIHPEDPGAGGPVARAARTQEMQIVNDATEEFDVEEWRERAQESGYRSMAAIPVAYDGVLHGTLCVYAERPHAFTGEEGEIIGQLGEVVGHAITAIDRKRALTSDQVHELEFEVPDFFAELDLDVTTTDRIVLEQAIPRSDGGYLLYGTAVPEDVPVVEMMLDANPKWDLMREVGGTEERTAFELRLSESPILTLVADRGGYVKNAWIDGDDYHMTVLLPYSKEVRGFIEAIRGAFPVTGLRVQRQVARDDTLTRSNSVLNPLTARQQEVLRTAYFAGFYEWPRGSTGEEVAESLGVTPATFSQHLRAAERQIVGPLIEGSATVR